MNKLVLLLFVNKKVYFDIKSCLFRGRYSSSECTPNYCDIVSVNCTEAICGPTQILEQNGPGPCDCCPRCVDIVDKTH